MGRITAFAFGTAIGCAFGALAALALAPRSGAQTRELMAQRAGDAFEDARDFNAGVAYYAKNAVLNRPDSL